MPITNKWKLTWAGIGCATLVVIGSLVGAGSLLLSIIFASVLSVFDICIMECGYGKGDLYEGISQSVDRTPQWSADGQTLVVNLGGDIYGASVDGNRLWYVAYRNAEYSGVFGPALSVNGEAAYLRYHYLREFHIEIADANGVNAAEPNRLFSETGKEGYPKWSPNGSRLAFSANGNMTIMTKREVGQLSPWSRLSSTLAFWRQDDVRRKYDESVIENRATRRPIVWSNDGQRIAYIDSSVIYNDYTDEYDISVDRIVNMRWDGADEKIAMEQQSRRDEFRPALFEPTALAWSPADDRIYFVYYELADGEDAGYTPSVRSVRPDGSDERIIAVWTEGFRVKGLKLSPDGSQLLFTTHRSPKDFDERISDEELYVMNIDGSEAKKVFEPLDYVYSWGTIYASWSPDGSRIAVHDLGHGGNVFTISPDGADARVVIGPGVQPGYGKPLPEAAGR